MTGNEILAVLMFGSFMVLVFTGFPVAWILGGLAVAVHRARHRARSGLPDPIGIDWNYTSLTVDRIWNVMENWVMVALPMFIFMGLLLDRSGIARELMTRFRGCWAACAAASRSPSP
jgi:TRAP-type mannitol/chloroaromatic compound transport system permease large subunit